jgi:hypothetical protein
MGMFDTLEVLVDLPDGISQRFFQTKDFECEFESYTVSKDKRLLDPSNKLYDFTGHINFYDYNSKSIPNWRSFNAIFEKGILIKIEIAEDYEQ